MTKDEALRLALEALKENRAWLETDAPTEVWEKNNEAITAIKAALEVPEEKYIYGTPLLDAMKGDKHDAD
jgi:hypothetical protein